MENQGNSQLKQSLIYGGILGLVTIVVSVVAYMFGQMENKAIQWVNYVAEIVIIIMGVKNYRDQHLGGYISYGKALGTGFLIGLIGGIIGLTYFYIFISYIDTGFLTRMMEKAQEEMINKGMSDDQVEMAMKYQQKFMTPAWMVVWGLAGGAVMHLIFSSIIAIFVKKKDESFEENFR